MLRNLSLKKEELQNAFPEFKPYLGQCRWNACTHREKERDCAVRAAVADGTIAPSRYESYCALHEQLGAAPRLGIAPQRALPGPGRGTAAPARAEVPAAKARAVAARTKAQGTAQNPRPLF